MNHIDWNYFNKFEPLENKYLPARGDGETLATQAVTATCKLIYKWYNDGDVFDNTGAMTGWCNDISGSANWLLKYVEGADEILYRIGDCYNDDDYEELLKDLADHVFNEDLLAMLDAHPKQGCAYTEPGPFKFEEYDEYDDEDAYYEGEYDEYDCDEW